MKDLVEIAVIAAVPTTLAIAKDIWVRMSTVRMELLRRADELAKEQREWERAQEASQTQKQLETAKEALSALPEYLIQQIGELQDEANVLRAEKYVAELHAQEAEDRAREGRETDAPPSGSEKGTP